MSRYIDADVLLERLNHFPYLYREVIQWVNLYKTADVREVVHGKWIKDRLCTTNGGTYGVRRCSICEDYYQDVGYGWDYCPNCGADMRGEDV